MTGFRLNDLSLAKEHHVQSPSIERRRDLQFASDVVAHGPLYALANFRIHSPDALVGQENWEYWTKPKSNWIEGMMRAYPPRWKRKMHSEKLSRQDHATGIEAHYDVSNEFYELFLDRRYRFYTCADFLNDQETLEEAQTNKAENIRSLLRLSGTEKILDLGCGWGAMLRFLRETGHKGEINGMTLSKEQMSYDEKLEGMSVTLCNFVTERFSQQTYDRIYSIGALEHVRPAELVALYQKMYDALPNGGLAVHQFFSYRSDPYPISIGVLGLFFPGSMLSRHCDHIKAAESAGFRITHDSIHDYKPTIKAWYEGLVTNRDKAMVLVGLETYNRYMTYLPIAWLFFQKEEADLHRIVTEKY